MIQIKGMAYLPEPGVDSSEWKIPAEPIPLRVEFDSSRPAIGTARLTREQDGTITCTAYIADELPPDVPKLAAGVVFPAFSKPELYAVSVVKENQNPDIPPYEITLDGSE